jgi:hypothetical protein
MMHAAGAVEWFGRTFMLLRPPEPFPMAAFSGDAPALSLPPETACQCKWRPVCDPCPVFIAWELRAGCTHVAARFMSSRGVRLPGVTADARSRSHSGPSCAGLCSPLRLGCAVLSFRTAWDEPPGRKECCEIRFPASLSTQLPLRAFHRRPDPPISGVPRLNFGFPAAPKTPLVGGGPTRAFWAEEKSRPNH